jgi:hypothetical protein
VQRSPVLLVSGISRAGAISCIDLAKQPGRFPGMPTRSGITAM